MSADKTVFNGTIIKALSGFYYVGTEAGYTVRCKARGKFRKDGVTPLVGDKVSFEMSGEDGIICDILPRRNVFIRPPVANIDRLFIFASAVNPITDPFLIDRMAVIAESRNCEPVICINKSDLDPGDALYDIYSSSGYLTIRTSAVTGEGLDELREAIKGRTSAFSGNSGVGKSSILNALSPSFSIPTGEVSDKLGRGRHTTRHTELYDLGGAFIMDTPGFSSFDTELMELTDEMAIQYYFPEFEPYLGQCRFDDCRHVREKGCAITDAVAEKLIPKSRHDSYVKLYQQAKNYNEWEHK